MVVSTYFGLDHNSSACLPPCLWPSECRMDRWITWRYVRGSGTDFSGISAHQMQQMIHVHESITVNHYVHLSIKIDLDPSSRTRNLEAVTVLLRTSPIIYNRQAASIHMTSPSIRGLSSPSLEIFALVYKTHVWGQMLCVTPITVFMCTPYLSTSYT